MLSGDDDGFVTLWRFPDDVDSAGGDVWDARDAAAQPTALHTWRAHNFPVTKLAFLRRVDSGRPG